MKKLNWKTFAIVLGAAALLCACSQEPDTERVNPTLLSSQLIKQADVSETPEHLAIKARREARAIGHQTARENKFLITKNCDSLPIVLTRAPSYVGYPGFMADEYISSCRNAVVAMQFERRVAARKEAIRLAVKKEQAARLAQAKANREEVERFMASKANSSPSHKAEVASRTERRPVRRD